MQFAAPITNDIHKLQPALYLRVSLKMVKSRPPAAWYTSCETPPHFDVQCWAFDVPLRNLNSYHS